MCLALRAAPGSRATVRAVTRLAILIPAVVALAILAAPLRSQADPCEAPLPRRGEAFSGPVPYVGDGDSLCVDVGGLGRPQDWVEVRLEDFWAPELSEPNGPAGKAALTRLALGRWLTCTAAHRSYDRIVARCVLEGRPLADRLRAAGAPEGGRGKAGSGR